MKVTRLHIVARGLTNCCPNCGAKTLFKAGKFFEVNKACSACGFTIDRNNDEGFYLGSASLNYGMTIVLCLLPTALLWYFKKIDGTVAAVIAGVAAIGFPVLFYRSSRSWWLMNYYLVFPQHLPANGGKGRAGEDDNV
jgi:hypothetical protein